MPLLINAQMTVSAAPGTGVVTLGGATPGAQSFAAGGAVDGEAYSYRIEEGAAWEIGIGTYTAASTRLTRTTVLASSAGGAAVAFTASAVVSQVALPADIVAPGIGDIVLSIGNQAPPGTLKLNGAVLPRAGAYAALWAFAQGWGRLVSDGAWQGGDSFAFSTGDGSSNFRLPDARGEFFRMFDDGRGLDSGRGLGTVQFQQLSNHDHATPLGWDLNGTFQTWIDSNGYPIYGWDVVNGAGGHNFAPASFSGRDINRIATSGIRGGPYNENRPRNVAPLACIRYK